MYSIYKYILKEPVTIITAPIVKWLNVDYQEKEHSFVVWAIVDLDEKKKRRFGIVWFETGEKILQIGDTVFNGLEYLGTAKCEWYVAHFFVKELNPKNTDYISEIEKEELVLDNAGA
jgi:hypothetical protein